MDGPGIETPRARRFALAGRGGEMAALEFGPADRPIDILFSHANGFNARTYRTILGPLGADLRILAVDLRGHGTSTLPTLTDGRTGWNDVAEDLIALLQQLDGPPLVMAGHSMGGTSSLLAAAEAPERASRLVLFDPVMLPPEVAAGPAADFRDSQLAQGALRRRAVFPGREAAFEAYRGRGAFKSWSDAQLADYVAGGFRDRDDGQVELACAPAWESSNFAVQGHDCWDAIARVRAPVRILRAEHESTARTDGHLDELAATGRVSVETAPGTSHFLPMERPELVREALRSAAAYS